MTTKVGQAEHLAETARDVAAIAAQLERAATDYSADGRAGHGDSWRLDHELVAAERGLRQIRDANRGWRELNEAELAAAAHADDLP